MQIFLFFALFISVLAVIFAVQNNVTTTVQFAMWEYKGSLALVLLVALACGALISFLVSLPSNVRARWAIRQQRKKIGELEKNLTVTQEQLDLSQKKADQMTGLPAAPAPAGVKPVPQGATVIDEGKTETGDSEKGETEIFG